LTTSTVLEPEAALRNVGLERLFSFEDEASRRSALLGHLGRVELISDPSAYVSQISSDLAHSTHVGSEYPEELLWKELASDDVFVLAVREEGELVGHAIVTDSGRHIVNSMHLWLVQAARSDRRHAHLWTDCRVMKKEESQYDWRPGPGTGMINALYVQKGSARSRGLGTALVIACCAELKQRNRPRCLALLQHRPDFNKERPAPQIAGAHRLLQRLDFHRVFRCEDRGAGYSVMRHDSPVLIPVG